MEAADILIVDDDATNLFILSEILRSEGYAVRTAASAESAFFAIDAQPPDLVLLDICMPGINGYEACERLRTHRRTRALPVIFISAMNEIEDKLMAFQAGGVDFIGKPFHAAEVLARVKTHIELHRTKRRLEQLVDERTQDLEESEARYRVLFEDSPLAVIVYDPERWQVLTVNAACTRIIGEAATRWIGNSLDVAIAHAQREPLRVLSRRLATDSERIVEAVRLRLRHESGGIVETEGTVQRIDYAGRRAQVLMLQDVTEHRHTEQRLRLEAQENRLQLERSAFYDALTGLPNRSLLVERMRQAVAQAQQTGCWLTVCYLDIDDFGALNERHGQTVCNHLLINAAECLRSCLRGGDTLARIGGDDFALIALGLHSNEEVDRFLHKLQTQLSEPFISDTVALTLSASIGVTIYPNDDSDPDTLLRHADQAMMRAKQTGKGNVQHFDPERDRRMREQRETIQGLHAALDRREFVLHYQPKVDFRDGRVVGAEALIRWQHPERGLLPPASFLPAIEADPLIAKIGDWVICEALAQIERWQAQGLAIAVSVNVAALHLVAPGFVERLRELLKQHPAATRNRLELEVLETSSLEDIDKVEEIIVACRELGVGFSIDDFGTGYSSLTYLRRLSADTLKIDQSFVCNMLDDPDDKAIVSAVIALAAAFQRKVIAEGVETVAHAKALVALGCTLAQGYGVARPMPAAALPDWIAGWPENGWLAEVHAGATWTGEVRA
jgi:diguanylate cyclase (GGDEF)-like protein/PAS domain S-box-containing protein